MAYTPIRFIDDAIRVEFDQPPVFEKTPPCPQRFAWLEETLVVEEMLAEWSDFNRRGRMARNMQPGHAAVAASRGSLGVGRFFFRVRVTDGRIFDIYYDRAIQDADRRKGQWVLWRELEQENG